MIPPGKILYRVRRYLVDQYCIGPGLWKSRNHKIAHDFLVTFCFDNFDPQSGEPKEA